MNLLLLNPEDLIDEHSARVTGRRFEHMMSVQKLAVGDAIRCGMLNGKIGQARVTSLSEQSAELHVETHSEPPKALPLTLILAMPRPKMLKRTLESCASLGVKKLILLNAYRVEKSFWSTPILQPEQIDHHFRLGLEQAGDTRMPELEVRKRFKPFVEDELPALAANRRALIAHPYQSSPCPEPRNEETLLVIGPEGGFIPYEVDLMRAQGLEAINLGSRILRVETAVPVLLSRLFPIL